MYSSQIEKLPKSKVVASVVLPPADFSAFAKTALEEIARDVELEGFRKGTAPKELVRQRVGAQAIMERAAKIAIENIYPQVVVESKLEPLGYPEVEITKLAENEPLEFKATVSVFPEIKLADYKLIASKTTAKEVEVTSDEIKRLKMEKERHEREHEREDLIGRIANESEFDVPEVLVAGETEKMMRELKEKTPDMLHMSFEDYLEKLKKTEKDLYDEIFAQNQQKIRNYLALEAIAKQEKIEPTAGEIEAAVKRVADDHTGENLDSERLKEYYRDVVKTEKVFELLESLFGNAKNLASQNNK
jgi:FKBP-type peptidyl-prolyl cis-trans isomerase (trigger factor)